MRLAAAAAGDRASSSATRWTTHALAGSAYNERRADCEAGVRLIAQRSPEVRALRDVTPAILEASRDVLPERIYRRCRHVVTENARVACAAGALKRRRPARVRQPDGRLASQPARRLRGELPRAGRDGRRARPGLVVLGARMTGGGFGGCTVESRGDAGRRSVLRASCADRYRERIGPDPRRLRVHAPRQGADACPALIELGRHPHRRYDPLRGEWVQVSPQRNDRPWQGQIDAPAAEDLPAHDPGCYLCPGNRREPAARRIPDYTSTFVFDNDFAALRPATPAASYRRRRAAPRAGRTRASAASSASRRGTT